MITLLDSSDQWVAGVGNATASLTNFAGSDANSTGAQGGDQGIYNSGSQVGNITNIQGDVIAMCWDGIGSAAYFWSGRRAGGAGWVGGAGSTLADPVAGTNGVTTPSGACFPLFTAKSVSGVNNTCQLRTQSSQFTYPAGGGAPPTGYTAWDSASAPIASTTISFDNIF